MRELYWIANYSDKTVLRQFFDGKENSYQDIDRNRLERFDLLDWDTNKPVYSLYLREGQRLIFRRRTLKQIGKPDVTIFLVGYQIIVFTEGGPKSIVVINYLHEDGSIALDGPRNNLELLSFE